MKIKLPTSWYHWRTINESSLLPFYDHSYFWLCRWLKSMIKIKTHPLSYNLSFYLHIVIRLETCPTAKLPPRAWNTLTRNLSCASISLACSKVSYTETISEKNTACYCAWPLWGWKKTSFVSEWFIFSPSVHIDKKSSCWLGHTA